MARYKAGETAILLSGGLDSSAILGSLIAQGIAPSEIPCLIKTYRLSADWRDEPHLVSLQRRFGLTYHEVPSDQHNPLQDMETWLDVLDGPYMSYGHSVASNLLFEAKRAGWRNLLSGHGGDEVVGYGLGRLNELARQRRLLVLWREIDGMTALSGQSRLRLMRKYLTHNAFYRRIERRVLRAFPDPVEHQEPSLNVDAQEALPDYASPKIPALLRSEHDDLMVQIEALEDPVQQLALETIGQSSRSLGLNTSLPFYDRDLVELSLSLPSSLKLRGGMTRYVLRAAMRGRLPADVLSRQDKYTSQGPLSPVLQPIESRSWRSAQMDEGGLLSGLVNKARLKRVRDELARSGTQLHREDARFIWRCSVLAMWNGQLESAPGVLTLTDKTGQF
ncbi:MAG: asparagine synthase [Sphingopyxis sp.]|nr:asparagine synthase [Sphingopyxis sp.]